MKAFVLVHPFFSLGNLWPVLVEVEDRQAATPITPEPPKLGDDPGEPEREQPFWTYFIDNPRPKS